jgi:hypothetical protein
MQKTYKAILKALRDLADKLPQTQRTVQHVAASLAISGDVANLGDQQVRAAIVEMGNASRGMLRVNGDAIILNGDLEELERRVAPMTGDAGQPRRPGTFRDQEPRR